MATFPPPPAPPARRVPWGRILGAAVGLLVVFVIVANHIELNSYAIAPGTAQPVDPLVTVPPSKAHQTHGDILLTDVSLSQVTLLQWLPDKLSSDTQVVPAAEILGPATASADLATQGFLEMAQSKSAAKTLALRELGYPVSVRNVGAQLFAVAPGSPAHRAGLQVAQTITAADGTPTPDECSLIAVLHHLAPGQSLHLLVEQSTVTDNAVVRSGAVRPVTVRVGRPLHDQPPSGCPGVTGPSPVYLGVEVTTAQDFTYPFPIAIDTSNIGGPSAGLAMTLGVMDKLASGSLTGGLKVAATGTVDTAGDVGDVGGVPQKTIAVERAGAKVFFVPVDEYGDAKSKSVPGLRIFPVTTLDQVLADLRRLGGRVPPPAPAPPTGPGTTTTAP